MERQRSQGQRIESGGGGQFYIMLKKKKTSLSLQKVDPKSPLLKYRLYLLTCF